MQRKCYRKKFTKKSDIDIYYIGNHNNVGLDKLGCKYEKINISNSYNILNWAQKNNLGSVIIGSENPLENGVVDLLESNSIKCFVNSTKDGAKLETNKLFCRNYINKLENDFNISVNPKYYKYSNNLINTLKDNNIKFVIKQTGLAGGKGVYVMDDDFNY